MNIKNILAVTKKELKTYLNNPAAYIVALAFLLLWEFLFFRDVFLVGEISLNSFFSYLPWLFLFIIPALTMGSLAEEKNDGTLEFLLTHPLSPIELVLGKFLGIVAFAALSLLFVFPLAWSFSRFGALDWGQVFGQYLSGIALAAVLAALGIFISSLLASQVAAFLLSAVANFFLIIVGTEFFSNHFPLEISSFLDQLSVSNHFSSMARGVIDTRDVWYFLSLTAVFLAFAYLNLIKSKYGNKKSAYRNYQLASLILLGIVILSNIVGAQIPGRIDLTKDKLYTLSPATKNIIAHLPDIVNVTLYASDKLPAQFQPVLRETKDTLNDYQRYSQGKIVITTKNPSTDTGAAKEATSAGIQPVRFNVVSQEQFQVNEGYLGIAIAYGGKTEAIPFVNNLNDLEYQLTSLISQLTVDQKPKVGFISGHGEKSINTDYGAVGAELKKQFDLVDIAAKSDSAAPAAKTDAKSTPAPAGPKSFTIPDDVKTIVIAAPTEAYSDGEKKALVDFMAKGGNVLFLLDGVTVSQQTMSASAVTNGLSDFLKEQTGVTVESDLVYDLRSNESVGLTSGQMRYVLPYPFWVRATKADGGSPIVSRLDNVTFPWASALSVDAAALGSKGYAETDLFTTTDYAGEETANFNISPDQKLSSQGLGKKLLALALSPEQGQGRVVVVGDADFLADQMVQQNDSNFGLGMEAISWLSQESSLSQIKTKNLTDHKFVFNDQSDPTWIKFGNLGFVFLAVAGYGSWHLWRRRKKKGESYEFND